MRIRTGLVAGVLLAVSLAGCGTAGNGDGVATAGGKSSAKPAADSAGGDAHEQALKFSKCMRDNGIPDYPDPTFNGNGGISLSLPGGVDKAVVDKAQAKCKKYLPNGGEPQKADPAVVAKLRQYAECMRENGVPKFPDPTDAGLQVDNDKLGVDPNGSVFKAADQKCSHLMPEGKGGDRGTDTGADAGDQGGK